MLFHLSHFSEVVRVGSRFWAMWGTKRPGGTEVLTTPMLALATLASSGCLIETPVIALTSAA